MLAAGRGGRGARRCFGRTFERGATVPQCKPRLPLLSPHPSPAARTAYTVPQEGCEFLVAESPEGLLDLQDSYVTTEVEEGGAAAAGDGGADPTASGGWRRPEGLAGVTRQTQRYQAVPWYSEYPGDIIAGKEPKTWVSAAWARPVVCSA